MTVEGRHELVTATVLVADLGGIWQRHFLPDHHFRLSLAMQLWRYLSADQTRAFVTLLDTVLFGVRDLGLDGRIERTPLAASA